MRPLRTALLRCFLLRLLCLLRLLRLQVQLRPSLCVGGSGISSNSNGRTVRETIGLPALAVSADGQAVFAGGHVTIWVGEDRIEVAPPTALPTKSL